jgi:tetratricopeptide (TPR) repeat protein
MAKALSIDKTLSQAAKAAKQGDWAGAQQGYHAILERFPANKRAKSGVETLRQTALPDLLKTARIAQGNRKWAQAEQALTVAAALAPEMMNIALALVFAQLETVNAPAALKTANRILKELPDNREAMNQKARALRILGQGAASREILQVALAQDPTDPQTLTNLGMLERAQGNRAAAAQHYRNAIDAEPKTYILHRNYGLSITYTPDHPHLAELQHHLATADSKDPANAPLFFAAFKALDDIGEKDQAFAHLKQANRLAKQASGYAFKQSATTVAINKALFQTPIQPDPEQDGLCPIYVTGLPRTGTTLIERMLGRAEGVQPCGELPVVQTHSVRLVNKILARDPKALHRNDMQGLRADLLKSLAEYSDGSAFLVDKTPLNFLWIGFICAALPEARIVNVTRDPMAVAWSLYSHSFDGAGNGFIYDPDDIARFMVLHNDMMAHWRSCFPGRIFDVKYEELVNDPETTSKAMAQATGLAWSSDWLTPERATQQVLTASTDQVRKPIYRDSNTQWKRYETQLAPMQHALRVAGVIAG